MSLVSLIRLVSRLSQSSCPMGVAHARVTLGVLTKTRFSGARFVHAWFTLFTPLESLRRDFVNSGKFC